MDAPSDALSLLRARPSRLRAMSPRVALVHHWLTGRRGGERVLDRIAELVPGAELFTLVHDPSASPAPSGLSRVHTSLLQGLPGGRRFFRALLPLLPSLFARFDLRGFDFVLSSDASVAKCVTVPPGVPHLVYCYSPPRYAHDQREVYLESSVLAPLRPIARYYLARVAARDAQAAADATELIAISEHVAARVRRAYGREAAVIAPPVDTEFFCPAAVPVDEPTASTDAFLLIGEAVPYKRFDVAVLAAARLDRPLIVAGGGPGFEALRRLAGPRTRFVPRPSDLELRELYRGCKALLFPGEEDFGLVPVEAMACGRPVIALGLGGAAETVVHGETGWLYAPEAGSAAPREAHVEALAEALVAFESIAANMSPSKAVARAGIFSAEAFARELSARVRFHLTGGESRAC